MDGAITTEKLEKTTLDMKIVASLISLAACGAIAWAGVNWRIDHAQAEIKEIKEDRAMVLKEYQAFREASAGEMQANKEFRQEARAEFQELKRLIREHR